MLLVGACLGDGSEEIGRHRMGLAPPLPADAFTNVVLASQPIGGSAGEFSVSEDGASTYTLPLWTPPGRENVTPNLALTYHSRGGPSEVGLGWSVAGLSVIARCGRDVPHDGDNRRVQFDDQDRLCLDGQRLVVVSGTYAVAGSEYRVERNGYAKITLSANLSGAAPTFEVRTDDGLVHTYQHVDGLRAEADAGHGFTYTDAVHVAWVRTKIADRSGNYMTLGYVSDLSLGFPSAFTYRLSEIRYTSHLVAGVGQRMVKFVYDATERLDETIQFEAGVATRSPRLLRRIEMTGPGEPSLLRAYELTHAYSRSTGRALLASIRECDGFARCLEPITFEYGDDAAIYDDSATRMVDDRTGIALDPRFWHDLASWYFPHGAGVRHQPITVVDLDRNGLDDLIIGQLRNVGGEMMNTWSAHLHMPAALPGDYWPGVDLSVAHDSPVFFVPYDHNHEGTDSVAIYNRGTRQYELRNWTGAGLGIEDPNIANCTGQQRMFHADVDHDGANDTVSDCRELVAGGPESVRLFQFRRHQGEYGQFEPTFPALEREEADASMYVAVDHDGDGDKEMLIHDPTISEPNWAWIGPDGVLEDSTLPHPGDRGYVFLDANGDGFDDVFDVASKHLLVGIGRGFVDVGAAIVPGTGPDVSMHLAPDASDVRVVNLNGDSRADFVIAYFPTATEPAKLVAYVSEGLRFRASSLGHPGRHVYVHDSLFDAHDVWTTFQPLDVDADSITDFVYLDRDVDEWAIKHNTRDVPDLLRRVNDFRGPYEVGYGTLLDPLVHEPHDRCDYPLRCIPDPSMRVVATHTTPTGGSHVHSYRGAATDVLRRSWLGFLRHRVLQASTGIASIVEYAQNKAGNTPYGQVRYAAHLPERRAILSPIGQGMFHARVQDVTWSLSPLEGAMGHYAVQITDRWERELEVATNGHEIPPTTGAYRAIHTTMEYDSFGIVDLEEQEHLNSAGLAVARRTMDFTITNDAAAWIIGRPTALDDTDHDDTVTTSVTRRTTYAWDTRGLLERVTREPTDPELFHETRYVRDDLGMVTEVRETDFGAASERVSIFEYDPERVFVRATWNPEGHLSLVGVHPGLGLPVITIDPNGVEARIRYDGFGRVRRMTHGSGSTGDVSYEARPAGAAGFQVRETGNDGAESITEFNRLGQTEVHRVRRFDGRFSEETFQYDFLHRPLRRHAPRFAGEPLIAITYGYDALSRVTSVEWADGTKYSTEYLANAVRVTHANGRVSEVRYDARGRIGSSIEHSLGGGFRDTRYWYAPFDKVRRVTRGTAMWQMTYDDAGRLVSVDDPDAGVRTFAYNAWNEPVERFDALGARSEYQRDSLGRVVAEITPEGTATFEWDTDAGGIGGLTRAVSVDGTEIEYDHDTLGRVRSVIRRVGAQTMTTNFTFDAVGRVSDIVYPTGGIPLRTRFDYTNGLLARIRRVDTPTPSTIWEANQRDAQSRITTESFAGITGPTSTARTYDPVTDRLASVRTTVRPPTGGIATVQEQWFTYDDHKLTRVWDVLAGRQDDFEYDEFGRIRWWRPSDAPDTDYEYDALDNLTKVGTRLLQYTDATRPHTLTRINGGVVTNDGNGRRTGAVGFAATYSAFDLPRTLNGATFRYDPFHVRSSKTVGTTATYYGGGFYERTIQGTNITHTYRIFADGRQVAEAVHSSAAGTSWYNLHDSVLGSTETVTRTSGVVAARYRYEPFGKRTAVVAGYAERRGFTGHEHDDELGVINMRGRMFDPLTGRFLTADPFVAALGRGAAFNRYAYAENDPMNATDPTGYQIDSEGGGGTSTGGGIDGGSAPGDVPDMSPIHPRPIPILSAGGAEDLVDGWGHTIGGFLNGLSGDFLRESGILDPPSPEHEESFYGGQMAGAVVGGVLDVAALLAAPTIGGEIGAVIGFFGGGPTGAAGGGAAGVVVGAAVSVAAVGSLAIHTGAAVRANDHLTRMSSNSSAGSGGSGGGGASSVRVGKGPWRRYEPGDARIASGCEKVARAIQRAIGGRIYRITPQSGRLLGRIRDSSGVLQNPAPNTTISGWSDHAVVVKNGRVYDALTGPAGEAINAYKARWEFRDFINWGF